MSSYYSSDLRKDVNRAEKILSSFVVPGKSADIQKLIPPSILAKAHGIMFIRLYRVGLLLSAKGGTGIIIARLPDGTWSAPSGISLTSVGFGHLAGGEVIDSIIVMNYRAAVKAFFDAGGQIQLGMGVSVAAGPLGRSASVAASASNKNHIAATYAYSSSKGLFVGYSFEGSKISERHNTNASFYGRQISAQEILTGAVPPPQMAAGLYNLLNSIGASGQQPGITFGPNNRYSAPPLPPHPHLQQKQHSYPPSTSSHSPTLSNVPPSMAPSSSPTVASPVSPSTTVAYPNEKNPQDHQFYNNQQPSSYNNQQQTTYNNQQSSFNENQPSYHRTSLQPSLSIRHPPQLNPNHPTTTADVEYIDPPPPYEPRKNEPTNNNNNNNNVSNTNNITDSSPVNNNMNNNNHNNMNVNTTGNNYNNTTNNNTNNNVQNMNSSPVFQQQQKPPVISQNYPSHSLPPQQLSTNSPSLIHLNSPALSTNAPSTAPSSSAPITGTYMNNNSNPYINNNNNNNGNGNGNGNTITVVAKYDFTAQQAGDLSFKVGDHITVTQWSGDKQSWWFGFIGHHSGQFPANFVDQIN